MRSISMRLSERKRLRLLERGNARQDLALEELERGAAARGAEGHLLLGLGLG